MKCLATALYEMGIVDAQIPDRVVMGDMPAICKRLDLGWHGPGEEIDLDIGEPIIVVYPTRPGYRHATFTITDEHLTERAIVGIITTKEVR